MDTRLVLLIVSLPPNPSSLRVRVWRRLRAIGAVALKRTVYRLPDIPDHYEHFQSLAQEIQRAGGEATLLPVAQIASGSSIPTRRSCLRTRGSFHGRNPVRHALRRAQPRRGRLHVRDASQADRLRDRRLTRLAEIVHEADLRDGKFPRDEARGIDLAIGGLPAAHADDEQVAHARPDVLRRTLCRRAW